MPPPSSSTPAIVIAGHLCVDVIPMFDARAGSLDALLVPGSLVEVGAPAVSTGGVVGNTGLALHRLGLRPRLIGKIGGDLFGQAILDLLRRHDPALADGMVRAPDEPSSYTIVLNPPGIDRVFLHCPGVNDTFHPDEIDLDRVQGARFFHFGYPPLMRQTFIDGGTALARLFERIQAEGALTSLDMARPDPESDAGRVDWTAWLHRVLPHVDLFSPSLDELLFMLDRPRYERLFAGANPDHLMHTVDGPLLGDLADCLLEMGSAFVVLKLGDAGLYLRTARAPDRRAALSLDATWYGRELLIPCYDVPVAGTTGAGDCTIAGLLAGLMHRQSPAAALASAVGVGACSVESPDSSSGVPPWNTVQHRIAGGWAQRPVPLRLEHWTWDEQHRLWRSPRDLP